MGAGTITARVDPQAITRVTRFFNAGNPADGRGTAAERQAQRREQYRHLDRRKPADDQRRRRRDR